jgi:hypothetical protein
LDASTQGELVWHGFVFCTHILEALEPFGQLLILLLLSLEPFSARDKPLLDLSPLGVEHASILHLPPQEFLIHH